MGLFGLFGRKREREEAQREDPHAEVRRRLKREQDRFDELEERYDEQHGHHTAMDTYDYNSARLVMERTRAELDRLHAEDDVKRDPDNEAKREILRNAVAAYQELQKTYLQHVLNAPRGQAPAAEPAPRNQGDESPHKRPRAP